MNSTKLKIKLYPKRFYIAIWDDVGRFLHGIQCCNTIHYHAAILCLKAMVAGKPFDKQLLKSRKL